MCKLQIVWVNGELGFFSSCPFQICTQESDPDPGSTQTGKHFCYIDLIFRILESRFWSRFRPWSEKKNSRQKTEQRKKNGIQNTYGSFLNLLPHMATYIPPGSNWSMSCILVPWLGVASLLTQPSRGWIRVVTSSQKVSKSLVFFLFKITFCPRKCKSPFLKMVTFTLSGSLEVDTSDAMLVFSFGDEILVKIHPRLKTSWLQLKFCSCCNVAYWFKDASSGKHKMATTTQTFFSTRWQRLPPWIEEPHKPVSILRSAALEFPKIYYSLVSEKNSHTNISVNTVVFSKTFMPLSYIHLRFWNVLFSKIEKLKWFFLFQNDDMIKLLSRWSQ